MREGGLWFLGVLASLGWCGSALAQPRAVVSVDATAQGTPLEPIWAYFGYDEVNYTTTDEGRALLRTLAAANESKVHVRTHFLFNSGDAAPELKWGATNAYTEDVNGAPLLDFTVLDQVIDAQVEAGVTPLFELGFMPQALSTRPEPYRNSGTYALDGGAFYPPKDYEAWAELVAGWATHARDRYSERSPPEGWLWELWNEPDIGYWQGTPAEFNRLYDYTEAALHRVLPGAVLGGPAIALPFRPFFEEFLEHCATGTNAVTGETGTRLDLVTFHAKGGVTRVDNHVQLDLGNQLRMHRLGFEAVRRSAFASTPIVLTEADPDGCAACPSSVARHLDYRNSPAYGAYEVAMMKRSLDLAEETGVDLRGVLTWAFTYPGTPYFAGYRALATNGVHLPVLNAFKLLGRLRGQRLPVQSSAALELAALEQHSVREQPDIDALATTDERQIQILVWHYHDDLVPADSAAVTLDVALPSAFGDHVRVTHDRVDEAHGNAFTLWQSQGSPQPPSASQRASLLAAMEALELEPARVVAAKDQAVSLSFELPRFGISLITLERALAPEPERTVLAGGGCSCHLPEPAASRAHALLAASLALALLVGRRRLPRTPTGQPSHQQREA